MAVLFILDSLLTLFVKKGASHTTSSLVPAQKDWHVTVIPVAKTTFLHSYVILCNQWQGRRRNGLIYNDLYTPIDLLTYSILSYPVLFFSVNTPVMVALFQPGMPPCSHATHVSSNPGFMVRAWFDEETLMDMAAPTPAAQCSSGAIATPQSCGMKDQKSNVGKFMA